VSPGPQFQNGGLNRASATEESLLGAGADGVTPTVGRDGSIDGFTRQGPRQLTPAFKTSDLVLRILTIAFAVPPSRDARVHWRQGHHVRLRGDLSATRLLGSVGDVRSRARGRRGAYERTRCGRVLVARGNRPRRWDLMSAFVALRSSRRERLQDETRRRARRDSGACRRCWIAPRPTRADLLEARTSSHAASAYVAVPRRGETPAARCWWAGVARRSGFALVR
jgi:hypothetical protein